MLISRPPFLGPGLSLAAVVATLRPQDVFATSLYTGNNGSIQKITTGFPPDLVWQKIRSAADDHYLADRLRGATKFLSSDTTAVEATSSNIVPNFYADGYDNGINGSGNRLVGWSFRRGAKFFDIVTYTGDGTASRQIPHGLGIAPGMIIVKDRDNATNWAIWHRGLNGGDAAFYNLAFNTNATAASGYFPVLPTSTAFTVNAGSPVNSPGERNVAYLFAHDPDTTNGIVQCGSSPGNSTIVFPYPIQFLMVKNITTAGNWSTLDTARGFNSGGSQALQPNTSNAEAAFAASFNPTASKIYIPGSVSDTYVYLAIRAPT